MHGGLGGDEVALDLLLGPLRAVGRREYLQLARIHFDLAVNARRVSSERI